MAFAFLNVTNCIRFGATILDLTSAKLGAPKIEGQDAVGGKDAPALYFGSTKMNNSLVVVNAVVKENGGAATLFVKAGDEYVRCAAFATS